MKERRIKILDPLVAAKIAAGEVVERPASVVKELVENSLDAGASTVTVTLDEGGRRLVRVADNGRGITAGDAPLAFCRNSTSKVESAWDLERIMTLGFRGEALYSIASVARVALKTRRAGEVSGTSVVVEGGSEPVVSDAGCPEGTSVEVRDLFYNTPARMKFLRSPATEFARCAEVVKGLALASPGVRFRLVRRKPSGAGAVVLDAPPATLKERISQALGGVRPEDLVEVSTAHIGGFIGRPETTYSNSRSIHLFVNGRAVRDRSLNRAIIDGYGSLIQGPRYPFAVLDVRIPPEEVDVNIHPAKSEVRFAGQRAVFDAVKTAVRGSLAGGLAVSEWAVRGQVHQAQDPAAGYAGRARAGVSTGGRRAAPAAPPPLLAPAGGAPETARSLVFEPAGVRNPELGGLKTVGQVWGEFLIAQGADDGGVFYIVDQHGAAERCAYEKLRRDYYSRAAPARQMLLLPERIETAAEEAEAVKEALEYLDRFGFEVVPFGPSPNRSGETFMVRSVPELLAGRGFGRLLVDLAVELSTAGGGSALEEAIDSALMTIACHSVIRGPRPMTGEEGDALLARLADIDFAAHCPHGRPVVKKFTRREIENIFKR
ncbi:MAG: DNA mismatch repair endonuclease MutL [Thermodesulfobacteriota bacterium]